MPYYTVIIIININKKFEGTINDSKHNSWCTINNDDDDDCVANF